MKRNTPEQVITKAYADKLGRLAPIASDAVNWATKSKAKRFRFPDGISVRQADIVASFLNKTLGLPVRAVIVDRSLIVLERSK